MIYFACFFLSAFLAVECCFGAHGWEGCPDLQKFIEETDPEHNTWKDLHRLFETYKDCDDGVYAEGFSDFVARSLAKHWDRLDELAKLSLNDNAFKEFVLRHIDATADTNDLSLLLSNAQKRCAASTTQLCSDIIKAAVSALEFNK